MVVRKKKVEVVDSLKELFLKCNVGILTDYRGLSAQDMTRLRRKLRQSAVEYKVVKNTLARFAAQRAGREELVSLFDGPVAVAFGYGDVTEPARLLDEYIRDSKTSLAIRGGFLRDRLLTREEVEAISRLPSREVLLARVVGGIQSPISALLTCLTAPIRGVMGILQARIQQLEGG